MNQIIKTKKQEKAIITSSRYKNEFLNERIESVRGAGKEKKKGRFAKRCQVNLQKNKQQIEKCVRSKKRLNFDDEEERQQNVLEDDYFCIYCTMIFFPNQKIMRVVHSVSCASCGLINIKQRRKR